MNIGFKHPQKMFRLGEISACSGHSYDLIPNVSSLIKKARQADRLSQEELAKKISRKTRSLIESYEINVNFFPVGMKPFLYKALT